MDLKDKITTPDVLIEAVGEDRYNDVRELIAGQRGLGDLERVQWWAVREFLRLTDNVYSSSDVLDRLNLICHGFIHVSTETPDMVAYTPDKSSGEQDRQIKLSLGKCISKLFPIYSDHYVRDLVAEHIAEIRCEVDFYTGQDIVDLYQYVFSAYSGATSCMAGKSFEVYPTQAYAVPDGKIKLAVIYKDPAKEEVAARCLVYEDGDDKRWIRNYGDSKLVKRLERLGFKCGAWHGVEFNQVRLQKKELEYDDGTLVFAMPYLDANGSTCTNDGSAVAYIDGKLRGLTSLEVRNMAGNALFNGYWGVPGTGGFLAVKPWDTSLEQFTCFLTGLTYSRFYKQSRWLYHNGEVHEVCSENLTQENFAKLLPAPVDPSVPVEPGLWREAYTYVVGEDKSEKYLRVWFDSKRVERFINERGDYMIANDHNYKKSGFVLLSEVHYPEKRWMRSRDVVTIKLPDGSTSYANEADTAWYLPKSGMPVFIHVNDVQKGDVALHKDDGKLGYVEKGVEFLRTVSGRKVHPMFNRTICHTKNGIDFRRNVDDVVHFGGDLPFGYKRADAGDYMGRPLDVTLVEALKRHFYTSVYPRWLSVGGYDHRGDLFAACKNWLYDISFSNVYPSQDNTFFTGRRVNDGNVRDYVDSLQWLAEFFVDFHRHHASYGENGMLRVLAECWQQEVKWALAEAQAEEAPTYLTQAVPVEDVQQEEPVAS